jgi:hypothetical protein
LLLRLRRKSKDSGNSLRSLTLAARSLMLARGSPSLALGTGFILESRTLFACAPAPLAV